MIATTPTPTPTGAAGWLADPEVRRIKTSELLRQGVVVRISISAWRPWTRLTPEDLGLPALTDAEARQLAKIRNLGRQLLTTPEHATRLVGLETAAHETLYRHSIETLGLRFVPVTAYRRWKEENAAVAAGFWRAVDALIDDWDEAERALRLIYLLAGEQAYRALAATNPVVAATPPSDWVAAYIERILAKRPPADTVRSRFGYRVELDYLDPESAGGPPATPAGDARLGLAELEADLAASLAARRARLADEFLVDCLARMYEIVGTAAARALGAVGKRGFLPGANAAQLKQLAASAPLLNFTGDPEMAAIIERVRAIAALDPDARDPVQIAQAMRAIATLSRRALLDLGRDPRPVGGPEVPDRPDDAAVRQARQLLALAPAGDEPAAARGGRAVDDAAGILLDAFEAAPRRAAGD
jgi:hypothetical protein